VRYILNINLTSNEYNILGRQIKIKINVHRAAAAFGVLQDEPNFKNFAIYVWS
jgi:hypothetical protein